MIDDKKVAKAAENTPQNESKSQADIIARARTEQAGVAGLVLDAKKEAEDKARQDREKAEKDVLDAKESARKAQEGADEAAKVTDEDYVKAMNEKDGLTLIHKDYVEANPTVERQGSKEYPGGMVVAKRK